MQQLLGLCSNASSLELLMSPVVSMRRSVEAIILNRDFVDQPFLH